METIGTILRSLPHLTALLCLSVAPAGIGACRRSGTVEPSGNVGGPDGVLGGASSSSGGAGGSSGGVSAPPGGSGGGGSTDATAGVTSGSGWLDDTRVWSAVPGGDACGLVQADLTQSGAPAPRTWIACGAGCLEASPASLPSDVVVARLSAAAAVVGGEAYLRLESGGNLPNPAVSGGRQYDLTLVTRLADGSLLAAVQQTQTFDKCGVLASERTPLLFPFIETGQVALVGTVNPGAGTTAWSLPQTGVPLIARVLSNNLGWGMQFDDGTIRILMPPTDALLKTIDQGPSVDASRCRRS